MTKTIGKYAYADKDVLTAAGSKKGTDLTQAKANDEAKAWDLIVAQSGNYLVGNPASRLPGMKAANPDLKLLLYMNTAFQMKAPGSPGAPPTAQFFKQCAADGTAYLRSAGYGAYLMRVDVAGAGSWRANRVAEANRLIGLDPARVDGVFMDLGGRAPTTTGYVVADYPTSSVAYKPRTCPAGHIYEADEWMEFTSGTVGDVKAGIASSKLVFANGFDADFYDETRVLWDSGCDYAMDEGFLRSATAPITAYPSEASWLNYMTLLGPLPPDQGDAVVAAMPMCKVFVSATTAQVEAWRLFAMASLLMGTDGGDNNDRLCFVTNRTTVDDMVPPSWYSKEIGTPTSDAPTGIGDKVNGVYKRTYTHGLVIVNPTNAAANAVVLPAGASYVDTAGATRSGTISVPAHTALILFGGGNAPSAPTGLALSIVSPYQVKSEWTNGSDADSDRAGTEIWRRLGTTGDYAKVGTVAAAADEHVDTSTGPARKYQVKVRAFDAQGNFSQFTAAQTITTPGVPSDVTAPTVPGSVTATQNGTGVDITHAASTDADTGVKEYLYYRQRTNAPADPAPVLIATLPAYTDGQPTTGYHDPDPGPPEAELEYGVKARDRAPTPNTSAAGTDTVTIVDVTDPEWPAGTGAHAQWTATATTVTLYFPTAADDVAVDHYDIDRTGDAGPDTFTHSPGGGSTQAFTDTTLAAGQANRYEITAVDAEGNQSTPLTADTLTPPLGQLLVGPNPISI